MARQWWLSRWVRVARRQTRRTAGAASTLPAAAALPLFGQPLLAVPCLRRLLRSLLPMAQRLRKAAQLRGRQAGRLAFAAGLSATPPAAPLRRLVSSSLCSSTGCPRHGDAWDQCAPTPSARHCRWHRIVGRGEIQHCFELLTLAFCFEWLTLRCSLSGVVYTLM